MPDLSTVEVARMHADNSARMTRIEERQDKHGEQLSEIKGMVERIDERTEKLAKLEERQDSQQGQINDLSADMNKARGAGRVAIILFGLMEGLHISWERWFGK